MNTQKSIRKLSTRALFPLTSFRLTYFLLPALRLFPWSLLGAAAVAATEAAAALSASRQGESIQHGLGETTDQTTRQFPPKTVRPAEARGTLPFTGLRDIAGAPAGLRSQPFLPAQLILRGSLSGSLSAYQKGFSLISVS